MNLVDTHCHIQSIGQLGGERHTRELWQKASDITPITVVRDAADSGVTKLVCVGCDLEDSKLARDFVSERDNCWASIGIHPHEAKNFAGKQDLLDEFAHLARSQKVIAVGECGFDYYYNHSTREAQLEIFEFQVKVAQQNGLPMIFHVREAFDDFWPVIQKYPDIQGVVHSFTDNTENMRKAVDRGFYIGVNGIATFAKNPEQLEVYRSIPLDNLVLETDAPYLTPVPLRGNINQPKHINHVADFLAELRSESREDLAAATTLNAEKLFGI